MSLGVLPDRRPPVDVRTAALNVPQHPRESERFMDWRQQAACLDDDPELFFPVGTTGPALEQVERAKSVCRSCTVIDQCLEWALESNQDAGVWGGMSEDERRTLRRSRQRRRRLAS